MGREVCEKCCDCWLFITFLCIMSSRCIFSWFWNVCAKMCKWSLALFPKLVVLVFATCFIHCKGLRSIRMKCGGVLVNAFF